MVQNLKCDVVTFLIGSTLWPKTRFVTLSHSLLGQLYSPERDIVTLSHSLLGQLYGPKRDSVTLSHSLSVQIVTKNCSKTAIWSKTCSKTVNTENVTLSHSLFRQLYGPEYTLQNEWQCQKLAFFQMVWRDGAIGLILYGMRNPEGSCSVSLQNQLRHGSCDNEAVWQRNA